MNLVALIIDEIASKSGKVFAEVVRVSEARALVEREQLDSWMEPFHSKGDFFAEELAKRDGPLPISSAGGTA